MKKWGVFAILLSSIGLASLATCALFSIGSNDMVRALNGDYELLIDRAFTDSELTSGKATLMTKLNNPVEFDISGGSSFEDGVAVLSNNGTISNASIIKGITKINVLIRGEIEIKVGYSSEELDTTVSVVDNTIFSERVFSLEEPANYFAIKAIDETEIKSISVYYSCYEAFPSSLNLKTAVFADIQLQKKDIDKNDGSPNLGLTSHAYLALKNHLSLAKEQGVEAIMMVGDIINNASQNYYDLYQSTLESVYGKDSSKYPAIIATMGNHEWWDLDEKTIAHSVSMFNQTFFNPADVTKYTSVKFSMDNVTTLPTYYRVVKGVPFLMVSGEDCTGLIGDTMKTEIASWLEEMSDLPSVRNGGHIYVGYHYPLSTTLTHGNGSSEKSAVLEDLLRNYPQAVVFTGDTHYSGINERAINQVDFTTINIGSSSYSRVDRMSATMEGNESFYNMKNKGSSKSDVATGNASFKYEYTPTIHMMDSYDNGRTVIKRYFSTDSANNPTLLNDPWTIQANISKNKFSYTNDRIRNTAAAQYYYGANGVSWAEGETVKYGKFGDKLIVKFNDTIQYHYTEHFKIEVFTSPSVSETYDVVSNYYKYSLTPEELYFVLDDLPRGEITKVSVTAYDYFDNPSLNTLVATSETPSCGFDLMDDIICDKYSDISQRLNLVDTAPNSKSSLEYYYNGVYSFSVGAITTPIISRMESDKELFDNPYISLTDEADQEVAVKAKVKNLSNTPLIVGLTLVSKKVEGGQIKENWNTDFGAETHKTVPANSGWVELEWSLFDLYQYSCKDDIYTVNIKTKAATTSNEGYSMNFLVDDVDIFSKGKVTRVETLSDGWENMVRDTGWETVTAEFDKEVTSSEESVSSLRCSFATSKNDTYNLLGIVLSPQHQEIHSGLNATSGTITAKFKFSENITDYRVRLSLVGLNWEAARYDLNTTYLGNGWYELNVDLTNLPAPAQINELYDGKDIIRIAFGFHGVTESNRNSATVWIDEVHWNR